MRPLKLTIAIKPMPSVTPTFAEIDFGLPGGDLYPDDAQSLVKVEISPRQVATVGFTFPGVDGAFQHTLGKRNRRVRWNMVIRAKDLDTLNEIERNIEDAQTAGVGQLKTTTGRVFQRVVLTSYEPSEGFYTIRGGEMADWVLRKAMIEFTVLSGD